MEKRRVYLCYGSNLNHTNMQSRCPGAKYKGKTNLLDYQLVFRSNNRGFGVATIEEYSGGIVPVGLWEITTAHEKALDRYEGVSQGVYYKKDFIVEFQGERITAFAYILSPGRKLTKPNRFYYITILGGYLDCQIDLQNLTQAVNRSSESNTESDKKLGSTGVFISNEEFREEKLI